MSRFKKALLIGINDYSFAPLKGCVDDARKIARALSHHKIENEPPNYRCKLLISPDPNQPKQKLTEGFLRGQIRDFFKRKADSAILFFSGHGSEDELGGYMVTKGASANEPGISFSEIIAYANQSPIDEVTIILDCCHSGHIGGWKLGGVSSEASIAVLKEGVTLLASSRDDELSVERKGEGLFTSIIHEGLEGSAANIEGKVTIASIYAYADQLLGPWNQRPIFKSHVDKMSTLRQCKAKVATHVLNQLTEYFPEAKGRPLDPSYEPTAEPIGHPNEQIFAGLQQLRDAGLVEPVGAKHLYYAAMESKSCQLTALGHFYWKLVDQRKQVF